MRVLRVALESQCNSRYLGCATCVRGRVVGKATLNLACRYQELSVTEHKQSPQSW
jgi:hypothetical protein